MITSWKHVTQWMSVGLSSVLLILLLAGCSGIPGTSSAATPTPKPSPTATPTVAPTATPSMPVQTYMGTGFTIQYPQTWKAQASQAGVAFTDAQQLNTFTLAFAPNPGGVATTTKEADASLSLIENAGGISKVQPVNLPATTTVGGETWDQRGVTGTVTTNGIAVPGELILLVDNHPASSPTTKAFEIYYAGPAASFQQENSQIFQFMLQTFKFTA